MLFGQAIRNVQIRYYIDHDPDYRKTVFVSGMGRSGTTWLAELINHRNEYRLLFEPFDPVRVALAAGFLDRQYLRETDERRVYLAPAAAILQGYVRDPFVDQHNRKLFCSRRIVKEVRTNLLLRWLFRHFPEMPIVLIVRHPIAVAVSRQATDEDIDLQAAFLDQAELVGDYLSPFVDVMRSCSTPFERQIASWCIEYGIPLSQFKAGEIHALSYERLCVEPEATLRALFEYLGRPFDRRVLASIPTPSKTTLSTAKLAGDWQAGPRRMIDSWRDRVSPAQVERAAEIVAAFGLADLYSEAAPDAGRWLPHGFGEKQASRYGGRAVSSA